MKDLKKLSKVELKEELKKTNSEIVAIDYATIKTERDVSREKDLWTYKRKILARLNPINKLV